MSNGQFYGVITGTARPFREPGIDIRDTLPSGAPASIAKFDDNPERILVDTTFLGGAPVDLSTGTVLQTVSGVLDFTYSSDSYYDPSRLLLDRTYIPAAGNLTGMTVQPIPAPANTQFTVAAFNVERFFNTSAADDVDYNPVTHATEKSSAVDVTPDAYSRRLAKVSLAILNVLGSPDIVSLEEVENQTVADDIAKQISAGAVAAGQADPQYIAYGTGTTYAPYTNDMGGISIGFLVKPSRVTTVSVDQFGQNSLMIDPRNGSTQQTLNDRPPLVLHAGIKRAGAKDYPVTVISNHLRSLSSIDDPASGVFVRAKKEFQAEYLAQLIQGFQSAGEHVVSVGDYNVFEFSDGFTDVMATITGQSLLPANQVVTPGVSGIVNPPATDLVTLLPADQRWSYQEVGNAQILDHIVATSDLVSGANIVYAHFNADFPLIAYNDATTPAHVSDHDAAVGYFVIPAPSLTATLAPINADFGSNVINTPSSGQVFTFTNTGEGDITISGIGVDSNFAQSNTCGTTLAVSSSCSINVTFTPITTGASSGTLTITDNATGGLQQATLSGNGINAPAPVVNLSLSSLTFGNQALNTVSSAQTILVTNTGNASLTISSIVASGDFSQSNTCGAALAVSSSCNISVTFRPTAASTRTGKLTVTGASTNLATSLTGVGVVPDFTLTDTKGSANTALILSAGNSGTVSLTVNPVYNFTGTISITCVPQGTSVPTGITCTPPASFTLNSNAPVNQAVTFSTTSLVLAGGYLAPGSCMPWKGTTALAMSGLLMMFTARSRRFILHTGAFLLPFAICIPFTACGNAGAKKNPNGTSAGAYMYTVTATSGTTSHSETVTLTVQ